MTYGPVEPPVVVLAADPPAATAAAGTADNSVGDSIALSLSSIIGSLAGLLSWVIATRVVEPAQVGQAAQVVSAFILVAGIGQLNVGVGILRWLPAAGSRTSKLVWSGLLMVMPLSAAIGLVYVLVLPELGQTAAGSGPFLVGAVLFVLAAAGWGVFPVHDFTLVAIGKPWWSVWRNGSFAVVRLGLLVGFGMLGLGAQGVVLSWVGPIIVWIAVGSLVIAVLTRRRSRAAVGGTLPSRSDAVRFLGPTSIGHICSTLLYNQVTVLATVRFGDATGAKFFLVWQAVTVVDITATFFMNSLAVGVAREPHRAAELAAATRRRLLLFFLPLLAVGAILAGPLLTIVFGPAYAEADGILQLLLLGQAFRLVVAHELGVLQATGRALQYARLQVLSTVLVLGVVVVVPVGSGAVEALFPVAIGYVVVQVVCAAYVLLSRARSRTDLEVSSP